MKSRPSTIQDDPLYLHDRTGWFIFTSNSRNAEVAKLLDLPYVYCVGQYPGKVPNPKVVFIQPSRTIDPRNNKVEYRVVDCPDLCFRIAAMMRLPATLSDLTEAEEEMMKNMELAQKGLL